MKKRDETVKHRVKKRSTISCYIDEVCDYEARYERYGSGEYSYPPIVPKLLLSILICLKPLSFFISIGTCFLVGALCSKLFL